MICRECGRACDERKFFYYDGYKEAVKSLGLCIPCELHLSDRARLLQGRMVYAKQEQG